MVVTVFRSRVKKGVEQELTKVGQRMYELASSMPGFISYKDFMSEDGENLSLIEFDSLESVEAWRAHSEHQVAQGRGRSEFFSEYRIQVCSAVKDYNFKG